MNKLITLSLGMSLLLAACQKETRQPAAGKAQETRAARETPKPAEGKAKARASKVTRVVFLDKQEACDCTKTRIELSWNALTDALGNPPAIKVERVHMDTDPMTADPYKKMRPVMVAPAIYFLGEQDKLLEVLQGEVSKDKIKKLLDS